MKKIYLVIAALLTGTLSMFASYTITKFNNNTTTSFCTGTYPTSFVTGDFSINEGTFNSTNGFTLNQTAKTLIFTFNNGNFQFNPGVGTVSVTGAGMTVNSYTITATTITVNLSTASTNTVANVLNFTGIQVRAQVSGATGKIRRSGGTFLIDNKSNRPGSNTSLGDFTSATPVAYSSSTTTQSSTANVFTGTSDNQIIRAAVVITGTCSTISATTFNFNTTGCTAPSTDIATAKLYYTGTSTMFSTATLFGSAANPNGAFAITGNQAFTAAGTYYFWLTYDLRATGVAVPSDLVDAQFVSSVIDGNTNTPTTSNPAGTRTIVANSFYSIAAGNWSSTGIWSRTPGGTSCTCAPTAGAGDVYINNAVAVNGNYTVNNVTVQSGGNLSNTTTNILTVLGDFNTTGNGIFAATSSWALNNITLSGTGSSSTTAAFSLTGDLNVQSGTTMTMTGGVLLTVNGNLNVDGTLALGTSNVTCSNAAGSLVSGTGSITGSGVITLGALKSIPASANLTIAPSINIPNNITITNNGKVNMQNSITGGNNNSTWVNAANSTLNMGGTTSALLATGSLDATAVPNTVNFNGSGNQNITTPGSSGTYYNLYMNSSASGVKSLTGAVTVNGDLKILGSAQLNAAAAGNTIGLYGNWINNSTNATPFSPSTSTVTFNGANDSIQGTGITTFNNINIASGALLIGNATTGKVLINGNWVNDGDFDAASSDITFNGTTTISGASITSFNTIIVNPAKSLTLHATETDFTGTITGNGTISHNNGLVVCNGNGNTQNINGSVSALTLFNLAVDNASGSVVLGRPVTINNALTLTNGPLTLSSALTMANAATIFRDLGTLSAAPTFGTSVNVNYTGTTAVTTGFEIPASTTVLGTLTVNKTGGITLSGNITVNTNITFTAGIITTGSNKVTMANAATVTTAGAGKYVFGNLEKGFASGVTLKTFEIGDASNYTPVDLSFSATGTNNAIGKITASTTAGDHPQIGGSLINSSKSVNRYWTLTNSGVTFSGSYGAKFTFVAGDIDAGANTALFVTNRYNGSTWATTTTGARTALTTQFTGGNAAAFGDFQVGETGSAPTISCPSNITQSNDAGQCSAVVNFTPTIGGSPSPTSTYVLTGATTGSGSGTGSGLAFNVGTTTVQVTVSNVNGSNNCSFTVTVNDTENPTIGTHSNINVNNDAGVCGAAVTFASPSASDNCAGTTVVCTPASGSTFAVGTTTVNCLATDAHGNTASSSFTVTVTDTENPTIGTHANISVNNDAGQCGAAVTFTSPSASDNCAGTTVVCTPASGSTFAVGTTTVNCVATDAHGNTASSSFTVTVTDTENPTIGTHANINVNNDAGVCGAAVTFASPSASDNCAGTTVVCTPASGSTFAVGTTTVNCLATDAHGNTASSSFTVTVTDTENPTITAPADVTVCNGNTITLGTPSTSDNCGVASVVNNHPSSSYPLGTTVVTWTVTDFAGNTATADQNVTVNAAANGSASDIVICNATNANLALNSSTPGTTFTWTSSVILGSVSGNGSCSSACGTTITDLLTNLGGVHGIVEYTVTPISPTACPGSTFTVDVTVGAIPSAPVITGPQIICGIVHPVFTASIAEATSYNWVVPTGVSIAAGQGTSSIVTNIVGNNVFGNITCTASNNCGTGLAATFAIAKKPFPTTAIVGPSSLCGITTATYSTTSQGANSFIWTVPAGITITSGGTTSTITVSISPTFTTGNISAMGVNACGYVIGSYITVYGTVPTVVASISGPTNVCGLSTITYTAAGGTGVTGYSWTLPAGFTQLSTSGSSITVQNTGFTSGSISVQATNTCGTGPARALALNVLATTPGGISGPVVTCGMTSAVYSVAPVANAISYTWTLPAGASITSGQGTTAIVASFATPMIGNVSVTSYNGCANSNVRTLAVNKVPATPGQITGPSVVCGLGTVAYSITAVAGATNYLWVVPTGLSIISGQGTTAISVSVAAVLPGGQVKVYAQSACGNSALQGKTIGACASPLNFIAEKESTVSIYPNPATAVVNIELNYIANTEVLEEIYDVLGNVVLAKKIIITGDNTLSQTNIELLNKGMYFIKLIDSNNILHTERIIKN